MGKWELDDTGWDDGYKEALEDLKMIANDICKQYADLTVTYDSQVNARAWGIIDCCHWIVERMERL